MKMLFRANDAIWVRPKESINHSAVGIVHFVAPTACGVVDTDIAKCHICADNEQEAAETLSCHSQAGADGGGRVGAEKDAETCFTSRLGIISRLVWSLQADRPLSLLRLTVRFPTCVLPFLSRHNHTCTHLACVRGRACACVQKSGRLCVK